MAKRGSGTGPPAGGLQIPLALTQKGFGGGELGPQLLGRSDVQKYANGLLLCRNFLVQRHGALENRPGTFYCGQAANQGAPCRLRSFNYDSYNGYLLELSANKARVWANGAPLALSGAPFYLPTNYAPRGAIIYNLTGSNWWYTRNEQFNLPITLTITGSAYTAGSLLTLTASKSVWTPQMCDTGAVITVQLPGAQTIHVTLTLYSSGTVAFGTVDAAVPTQLQATPTVQWACKKLTFGIDYSGDGANPTSPPVAVTITITTGTTYAAGQPLTLTASLKIFCQEMVSQGTVVTFPSPAGLIQATITGWTTGLAVTAIANLDIPAAIQATATAVFNIPQSVSYQQFSPLGPTWTPDTVFPPGSPTIAISTASNFTPGQLLTLTASGNVFTNAQVLLGTAVVIHDGLGNTFVLTPITYSSATSVTATCTQAIPTQLQNQPTLFWSYATVAPVAGPFWYALTNGVVELPIALAQSALSRLQTSQFSNVMTIADQSMVPVEITRVNVMQWIIDSLKPATALGAPIGLQATAGYGPPSGSTLHTFAYYVTSVSALGEESLISNPATCVGNYPSPTLPNLISWAPVIGAVSYNVYGTSSANLSSTVPGFLGSSSVTSFNDNGSDPDVADQPPAFIPQFQTPADYPGVTGYFQQRLCFANSQNHPQRIWMSQTQLFMNFNVLSPTAANAAIEFDIPGQKVQPIAALVDIGKFVIHTASAEYICTGDVSGAITPTSINPVLQGGSGAAAVAPITIGITDIFVQARGGQVRDLRYTIQSVSYDGKDLTIFSPQLFLGRTIEDMTWQQIKDSIVWCLMDNGQLFGLTYIREHEIWSWHHHDTGITDQIESIVVVPEGQYDTLYLEIKRTVNNATVRYIERLAPREFLDLVALTDACFSDCSLLYDGRNTGSTTMQLSGSSWDQGTLLTITASGAAFSAGDVGNAIVLQQYNASGVLTAEVTVSIVAYTSATVVQGYADQDVPAWAQAAILTWGKAVTTFNGMTQLENMAISVLADGEVVSSPNNPNNQTGIITVSSGGAFTIPQPALVVCAGLPYISQIQTLPIENAQGETLTNKMQMINEVTVMFFYARGGFYGEDLQHLLEWDQRNNEPLSSPVLLYTGPFRIPISSNWEITGQIAVAQYDPLPMGVSAITPTGFTGR